MSHSLVTKPARNRFGTPLECHSRYFEEEALDKRFNAYWVKKYRLRVVPHFSSGIVERAKRERVKITPREKRRHAIKNTAQPPICNRCKGITEDPAPGKLTRCKDDHLRSKSESKEQNASSYLILNYAHVLNPDAPLLLTLTKPLHVAIII